MNRIDKALIAVWIGLLFLGFVWVAFLVWAISSIVNWLVTK